MDYERRMSNNSREDDSQEIRIINIENLISKYINLDAGEIQDLINSKNREPLLLDEAYDNTSDSFGQENIEALAREYESDQRNNIPVSFIHYINLSIGTIIDEGPYV